MPRKHATKKSSRKRAVATRRKPKLVSRGVPSGMPVIRRANLRYVDQVTLTSTSGLLGEYVFRANDLYDPNYTSTGHQPMGYDQWMTLYNHFVVISSKITVKYFGNTSINTQAGIYLSDAVSSAGYSNATGLIEARKGTYKFLAIDMQTVCTSKYNAKQFFNLSDTKDYSPIQGSSGSSPTEVAAYHLWIQDVSAPASTTVRALVTIDYIVEFREPQDLAQS